MDIYIYIYIWTELKSSASANLISWLCFDKDIKVHTCAGKKSAFVTVPIRSHGVHGSFASPFARAIERNSDCERGEREYFDEGRLFSDHMACMALLQVTSSEQ